jgi:CheY-like chemotaxis protein
VSVRRILVIDDDDAIREVAALSLETVGGWQVSTASSGSAGLEQARAEPPDAILLDVMMPGLDGPATLARLRAQEATRAVPVILLTAKVQHAERRRWEDLDVAGVLAKPFDPIELPTQIDDVLATTPMEEP